MNDGANYQAKAVLAFIQRMTIEESWNDDTKQYDAKAKVARWENCREQGYVISLWNKNSDQLNIAFFEHRNTDSICAVKWQQNSINSPTIGTAKFNGIYKDKWDLSHSVGYGEVLEMANWIEEQFTEFWKASNNK